MFWLNGFKFLLMNWFFLPVNKYPLHLVLCSLTALLFFLLTARYFLLFDQPFFLNKISFLLFEQYMLSIV